jgi:hypothetical protein
MNVHAAADLPEDMRQKARALLVQVAIDGVNTRACVHVQVPLRALGPGGYATISQLGRHFPIRRWL